MKQIFCVCIILLISTMAFAQTDDAGVKTTTKTTTKPTPKTSTTKKKTTTPKTSTNSTKPRPKTTVITKPKNKKTPAKIIYASLTLSVSEPESEIFLSNDDGNVFEGQDSALTDENGVFEINDVPVGSYTLTVRKNGFFDDERRISIIGGKVNSFSISLRPSAAFLSVSTNIEGTSVEIENVGEYQNSVENLLLAPGTYRVSVYKKGYISDTKSVSINTAGQKGELTFILNPLPVQELLSTAADALLRNDPNTALRNSKRVLTVQPENAKANLLGGLAYFKGSNPSDGVLLLSRAISYGETVSLPVRIFNKEKGNLQLIAGNLIFGRNSLEFNSANRPELNFLTSQTQFTEIFEKFDEFGIKHISINAKGDFNGKADRRTKLIYSEQTVVRASKKELLCQNCTANSCPCQLEETALYDLINRWRNGNFLAVEPVFGAVISPSDDFELLQTAKFSLKLPENWQVLTRNDKQIFAAPNGGYLKVENPARFHYSHGIDAVIVDNPTQMNLNQAVKNLTQSVIRANTYLRLEKTVTGKLPFGDCMVSTFKGLSPISKRQEIINLYTAISPNGDIFYITTVVPPDESADYENVFRRILNSVSFP